MGANKIINDKKGQIGIEYLIVVGFVTFAIMSIVALAFFYSGQIKDRIKLSQVEGFANQLVVFAEDIFFSGEPSKATIKIYIPDGVQSIIINSNSVVVTTSVSGGTNIRVFESKVPLEGSITTVSEGLRKISLEAISSGVRISEVS
ncbi:MAG: hypothetical protein AABW50_02640 [Nanoarchaeota archaeon]